MIRHLKFSPAVSSLVWVLIATFAASSAGGRLSSLPNGVASGDVTQTTAVLWAHSTALGEVTFEYSVFDDFAIVDGNETAIVVDVNQPVKVQISDLIPATQYYYCITDANNEVAVGRFRTPFDIGISAGLRFGASGDWQQPPPFPSLKNVPGRELDFFSSSETASAAVNFIAALYRFFQKAQVVHFNIFKKSQVILWYFGKMLRKNKANYRRSEMS